MGNNFKVHNGEAEITLDQPPANPPKPSRSPKLQVHYSGLIGKVSGAVLASATESRPPRLLQK